MPHKQIFQYIVSAVFIFSLWLSGANIIVRYGQLLWLWLFVSINIF